jgi:hypothetical protein
MIKAGKVALISLLAKARNPASKEPMYSAQLFLGGPTDLALMYNMNDSI